MIFWEDHIGWGGEGLKQGSGRGARGEQGGGERSGISFSVYLTWGMRVCFGSPF